MLRHMTGARKAVNLICIVSSGGLPRTVKGAHWLLPAPHTGVMFGGLVP